MDGITLVQFTYNTTFCVMSLQVLGHFVSYSSEQRRLPLVFVISEAISQLLLFPFKSSDREGLVECVLVSDIPLWPGFMRMRVVCSEHP